MECSKIRELVTKNYTSDSQDFSQMKIRKNLEKPKYCGDEQRHVLRFFVILPAKLRLANTFAYASVPVSFLARNNVCAYVCVQSKRKHKR